MQWRDIAWPKVGLWVVKVMVVAGVVLGAYWWWWLVPAQAVPQVLAVAEAQAAERYFALLEYRLAWQELTRLDPRHGDFARERAGLLATLERTAAESEVLAEQPLDEVALSEVARGMVREVRREVVGPLEELHRRQGELAERQAVLVAQLAAFEATTAKLATYQPAYDVGALEVTTDLENVMARLAAAQRGLQDIVVTLDRFAVQTAELGELRVAVTRLIATLDAAGAVDATADRAVAEAQVRDIRQRFMDEFAVVKAQVLAAELSLLQTEEALVILTDQANLVARYQHLLEQVARWQGYFYERQAAAESG